jgi:hypothetical protein
MSRKGGKYSLTMRGRRNLRITTRRHWDGESVGKGKTMRTTRNRLASLAFVTFITFTLHAGTYFVQSLGGTDGAPYPFDPTYGTAPMTEIGPDTYLVDDGESLSLRSGGMMAMDSIDPNDPGTNGTGGSYSPPNIRNYAKYSQQVFSLLDTNSLASGTDTNLYNACAAIPVDTNTIPILQIQPYGPNAVIIKASHFDYSAETVRDFTLLVCDKVETPTWKTIDFAGASDAQDGWLVQGTVPRWNVTDAMFMLVTNINLTYPAFFQAIPYSGPQVAINGVPSPYDVVSNTITLNAQILDLSGTTNEQFSVSVDGDTARFGFGTTNSTISLETKYNPAGLHNVYLNVYNGASVYDPTNAPDNTKLVFSSSASVPLDFENDNYVLFASDNASPEIGTNYFYYVISKAQNVAGIIFDPSDNHVVLAFTNYVPYAAQVYFGWNFTEADGVTPYTNDTYAVQFIAFDPDNFINTNTIERTGVRPGAGCYLSYQQEDPMDITGEGSYLNTKADLWLNQNLKLLYNSIYDGLGLTEYDPGQVGAARLNSDCQPLDQDHLEWAAFMQPALSNLINVGTNTWSKYSDLTIGGAHGNGATVGGSPYLANKFTPDDLQGWCMSAGTNWRLRKAAIWACYSGSISIPKGVDGAFPPDLNTIPSFYNACGIRFNQLNSYMQKNCGLFFGGLVPQYGYGGNASVTSFQVAEELDQTWVCGPNQYPGGCDPTYSFRWALQSINDLYIQFEDAGALRIGFPAMTYSSIYDDQFVTNNITNVKNP